MARVVRAKEKEMNKPAVDFSDLEDASLWEGDYTPPTAIQTALAEGGLEKAATVYSQQTGKSTSAMREKVSCPNCGGSGLWRGYSSMIGRRCFKCDGKGYHLRAAGYTARKEAEKAARVRKAEQVAGAMAAFKDAHPEVFSSLMNYVNQPKYQSDFMDSVSRQFLKTGSLTENQIAALQRGIDKRKESARAYAEARSVQIEKAPEAAGAGLDKLTQAFESAIASGLKNPALVVEGLCFKPAKASSQNAGAIYVTAGREYGSTYFGKLVGGRFVPSNEGRDQVEAVQAVMANPLGMAVAYGNATGKCSCCGRELENEESVKLGIGPVCRRKWGLDKEEA